MDGANTELLHSFGTGYRHYGTLGHRMQQRNCAYHSLRLSTRVLTRSAGLHCLQPQWPPAGPASATTVAPKTPVWAVVAIYGSVAMHNSGAWHQMAVLSFSSQFCTIHRSRSLFCQCCPSPDTCRRCTACLCLTRAVAMYYLLTYKRPMLSC
jgi:hypothetical protein